MLIKQLSRVVGMRQTSKGVCIVKQAGSLQVGHRPSTSASLVVLCANPVCHGMPKHVAALKFLTLNSSALSIEGNLQAMASHMPMQLLNAQCRTTSSLAARSKLNSAVR